MVWHQGDVLRLQKQVKHILLPLRHLRMVMVNCHPMDYHPTEVHMDIGPRFCRTGIISHIIWACMAANNCTDMDNTNRMDLGHNLHMDLDMDLGRNRHTDRDHNRQLETSHQRRMTNGTTNGYALSIKRLYKYNNSYYRRHHRHHQHDR